MLSTEKIIKKKKKKKKKVLIILIIPKQLQFRHKRLIWNQMIFARKKVRNQEEVNLEAFREMEINGKYLLW